MILRDIISAIEGVAPLGYQDDFDNSGLQVGFPSGEVKNVLICLDVTEAIVDEAIAKHCELIVSHHPLIFRALKQVSDSSYQQRCVVKAIQHGIAIYSAHTSLDNAPGGVNFKIAQIIGLQNLRWLEPKSGLGEAPATVEGKPELGESNVTVKGKPEPGESNTITAAGMGTLGAGSGIVGELPEAEAAGTFFERVARSFGVSCLFASEYSESSKIRKVALCGGAGAFLLPAAKRAGADCFICGEFHYHDYFENDGVLLAELGHYQSEQFTKDLLAELLADRCPELQLHLTEINTNPIRYHVVAAE